jgi:polyisoprenoid-binding protein YceI/uncharacterized membrane protein YiaA
MGTLFSISFGCFLLFSILTELKKVDRLRGINDLMLVLFVLGLFLHADNGVNQKLFWTAALFITAGFSLSLIPNLNKIIRLIIPILILPIFIAVDTPLSYGEYVVSFSDSKVILFIALGYLLPQIVGLKAMALKKLLGLEKDQAISIVGPVILGVLIFTAMFFHSTAGIMLVAIGLWAGSLNHNGRGKNLALFALAMLMVYSYIGIGNLDSLDFTLGKTIEGLLFGVFSGLIFTRLTAHARKQLLAAVLSLFMVFSLFAMLLLLGTQKIDLGGMDAFVAGIFGMALIFLSDPDPKWKSVALSTVFFVGVTITPFTIEKDEVKGEVSSFVKTKTDVLNEQETDLFDQVGSDLKGIVGDYEIAKENLLFDFELGPKGGRTKGRFKSIKGKVLIAEVIEQSIFDIELNVSELTTMNKFRDESLMGEEYFNSARFPKMTFRSRDLKAKGDSYEINGDFVMLGVKRSQIVQLKLVENEGSSNAPILIGKGSVDRTMFGMKPDPKEGNIVDFEYRIQLNKLN